MSTDTGQFDGTGRPTWTSTAVAFLVTAAVVALLLGEVQFVVGPAVIGIGGAVCFAASLWLVSLQRAETLTSILVSVLTVGVGIGLVVVTVGTALLLVGSFFPVESVTALSVRSLLLVGRMGIVLGCVLAVLGVLLGVRNVVDGDTLSSYIWLSVKTAMVPALVGNALVSVTYFTHSATETPALPGEVAVGLARWLLAPSATRTHLATLLLLCALAALGIRAAVGALPVAELLADSGSGDTREQHIEQGRRLLGWTGGIALGVAPIVLAAEVVVGQAGIRQAFGPALYRQLVELSTAMELRIAVVSAIAVAGTTVAFTWSLRRVARGSLTGFFNRVGPFAGGAFVTAGSIAVAEPALTGLTDWIRSKLPGPMATLFDETSTTFIDFFGAAPIVILLTATLVGVAAVFAFIFRVGLFTGYLPEKTPGYALASGGLFVAAAFLGTIGAKPWLVFAGIVGSLLVWDTGRYGTRLGAEIGRNAPTRNAELVHAGGTLGVGLVGTGLAYGLSTLLQSGVASNSPASTVALMGGLVGIVFLVAALR